MTDTRGLLNRIAALRQRMETAHTRLAPLADAAGNGPTERVQHLEGQVEAGLRYSALLDGSFRQLQETDEVGTENIGLPRQLTSRARRLLVTGQQLLAQLRGLSDSFPLESRVGPGEIVPLGMWPGIEPTDPLAVRYRETVAMLDTAMRTVQAYPDSPGAQLRLCEGLEGVLNVVTERSAALHAAVAERKKHASRIEGLAELLLALAAGKPMEQRDFIVMAEAILADVEQGLPMRFYAVEPLADVASPHVGTWHVRAVACHCLTVAGVIARLIRHEPDLRAGPVEPVLAGLVHDVGMLRIPAAIYAHPGPLDESQRRTLESHTRLGADAVAKVWPGAGWLADACLGHHERHDGTGYPAGMRQMQNAPLVRFLAVCDMYAALCTPRPHRPAREPRTALTDTLLLAEKGALDRNYAERLLQLSFYPVGSVVELADGSLALVIATGAGKPDLLVPSRPVIALLADEQGGWLPAPRHINLAECDDRTIVRSIGDTDRRRLLGKRYPEMC